MDALETWRASRGAHRQDSTAFKVFVRFKQDTGIYLYDYTKQGYGKKDSPKAPRVAFDQSKEVTLRHHVTCPSGHPRAAP